MGRYHPRVTPADPQHSEPYGIFARVYDRVMADIEYEEWASFILTETTMRGFEGGRILDLACGTGNSAAPMLRRGFETVGVDASAAMLEVARSKFPDADWLQGRFTDFSVPGRFGLVQCVFDALNNLLEPAEFLATAKRVLEHLEPGGLFMFDINTSFGLEELWEDGMVQGWLGRDWYGWKHTWDPGTRLATVEAGFIIGGESWLEVHRERAYDQAEIRELLAAAGFSDIEIIDMPWGDEADADAPRVWVVAKRPSEPDFLPQP